MHKKNSKVQAPTLTTSEEQHKKKLKQLSNFGMNTNNPQMGRNLQDEHNLKMRNFNRKQVRNTSFSKYLTVIRNPIMKEA